MEQQLKISREAWAIEGKLKRIEFLSAKFFTFSALLLLITAIAYLNLKDEDPKVVLIILPLASLACATLAYRLKFIKAAKLKFELRTLNRTATTASLKRAERN